MACRDGYSSSNTCLRPAAKQAKWSSRKFVRGEVVNFLGILGTDVDEHPSKHASDYGGSDVLYATFCIISLVNDLAGPRSGCNVRF